MNSKEEFLEKIKNGKWFLVKEKHNFFLVKMKPNTYSDVDTLWMSNTDSEAMCFSDFNSENWDFKDGTFTWFTASTYHFGSPEGPAEKSIYDESGILDVEKMKKIILDYANKDFITRSELDEVWNKLEQRDLKEFEILLFE